MKELRHKLASVKGMQWGGDTPLTLIKNFKHDF